MVDKVNNNGSVDTNVYKESTVTFKVAEQLTPLFRSLDEKNQKYIKSLNDAENQRSKKILSDIDKMLDENMNSIAVAISKFAERLGAVEDGLSELKSALYGLSEDVKKPAEVFSDRDLYELKQELSWSKLNKKTGIPISTLQYRVRKYENTL